MKHRLPKHCRSSLLALLLGLILVVLAVPVHAAGEEETVARNFLKFLGSDKTILSSEVLQGNLLDPALPPVTVGHLFHLQGGGYLLVSPDRSISPVKAYSLAGDFTALPDPYRRALLAELELRARVAIAGTGRAPLDAGATETGARWDFLLGFEAGRMPLSYTPGTHLLETQWNQTYPFNKFLPTAGGQTVVAGCVNVAVAQVMRYHKYPASAKGVASYLWDGPPPQTLKAILYRSFNWANMPATIDSATPEYQADEVALLIKDLGIANHTDFDFSGSSTSLNSRALMENFQYSTGLSERWNGPDQAAFDGFLTTLTNEIAAERPVLLTFPGHMTVADGYSPDTGAGVSVHVNMGWGGTADNFYFLDRPVEYDEIGNYFPTDLGKLQIHYGIKPCNAAIAGDCAVNLEAGDGISDLAISGNFNGAGDNDLYDAYLNGATTIRGARGYTNMGLYLSIADVSDGGVVFPSPDPNNPANTVFDAGSLAAGKYMIRVSLCNSAGTFCYPPAAGFDHYVVTLTSGTLSAEAKAAIDRGLEKPPVIGNSFPDLILNTASGTRKILIDARDENGDPITLHVGNSNPAAVSAVLNGNSLELTPTGTAKVSSRIVVTATANGKVAEKAFTVMTDNSETAFGKAFTVAGTFPSSDDIQTHHVILEGDCTIRGDNGYDGQAFFSSVQNASGAILGSVDGALGVGIKKGSIIEPKSMNREIYTIHASQCGPTFCYNFSSGIGFNYTLAVSCPSADESTTTIAGILGINLTGATPSGDVNADLNVTLADAVLALQILSGMDMTGKTIILQADANGDHRIGLAEAIFILQRAAGLRSP